MKRLTCLMVVLCLLLSGCSFGSVEDLYSTVKNKITDTDVNTTWKELFDTGTELLDQEQYPEAIEVFTEAIEVDPERSETYISRGDAYSGYAQQLLKESPEDDDIPSDEGDTTPDDVPSVTPTEGSKTSSNREKAKDYVDKAKKDYEKAQKLDPDKKEIVTEKIEKLPIIDIIPVIDTQPVDTSEPLEDILYYLDYYMIVSAMQEMGCTEVTWDTADIDGDSHPELLLDAQASYDCYSHSQLTVDAEACAMVGFTATGAAQSAQYYRTPEGTYGHYNGYHTVGNAEDNYRTWTGDCWKLTPGASGEAVTTLPCPELYSHYSSASFAEASAALQEAYAFRSEYIDTVTADFDGDGVDEQVLLLYGPTNRYFLFALHENLWGDEVFSTYFDTRITAVVLSVQGSGTLIRAARLDTECAMEISTDGDCLVLDHLRYPYLSEGIPFSAGEMVIAGNVLENNFFRLAVPDSWMSKTIWMIDEHATYEGICDTVTMIFWERNEYEETYRGHLVTIIATLEPDVPYENSDYMGILYYGSPADADCLIYNVYAVFPLEIQYTSETEADYISLSADIQNVLYSFDAQDGCYYYSYYR